MSEPAAEQKPVVARHAYGRLVERLAGIVPEPERLLDTAATYAATQAHDAGLAMKVAELPRAYGDTRHYHPDRASNGDEVWIVSRRQRLVTVMFRRSSQRKTCDGFDVNAVVDLTSTLPVVFDSCAVIQWRQK